MTQPFSDSAVKEKYESYSGPVKDRLSELRELVFDVHGETPGCGELVESLKWGQPAFQTVKPKSGSTLRIDASGPDNAHVSLYFICTTNLVEQFRDHYGDELNFVGNRELRLSLADDLPTRALRHCIGMTLTYNLAKRR